MERENMLDATPHPNFTPATSHILVPSSESSAAEPVLESEVETNEANLDKATFQPDAVSDNNLLNSLSAVPTLKMSYAEAASPKCKGRDIAGAKAALATKPAGCAVEASMSDLAMEPDFPPLSTTQPKASASTKTKPTVQQTATKRKAVEAPIVSDSAMEPDSLLLVPSQPKASSKSKVQKTTTSKKKVDAVPGYSPPTTAPSQVLNPKTPAPLKSKRKRIASFQVSETEPESPPPKPKPHSLQWLKSYHNLGDIDKTLCEPAVVPKQKKSGSKVDSSKAKDKGGKVEAESGVT